MNQTSFNMAALLGVNNSYLNNMNVTMTNFGSTCINICHDIISIYISANIYKEVMVFNRFILQKDIYEPKLI